MVTIRPVPLTGRDQEEAAVRAFLESAASGASALVLEGEAGIGKTAIWSSALDRWDGELLVARPGERDRDFPFAVLADLFNGRNEAIDDLPAPQRRALRAAIALEEPDPSGTDAAAVALGFRSALRVVATERPTIVAIDDVQWVDRPSASVLEFAIRRLEREPIAFLLTLRVEGAAATPLGLDRALPEERLRRLHVGPLSLGALHRMIQDRLGVSYPRPLLRRLHEVSGGNPFYALELGRALQARGEGLDPGQEIPLPESVQDAVRDRLGRLSHPVRKTLRVVSALAEPTIGSVEQASDPDDVAAGALDGAVEAGLLHVDGDRVRFTHPLLRSGVYLGMGPQARRRLHRRLADVETAPELRGRHLALASAGPSAEVGQALEEAAASAAARGAPDSAAELAEMAAGRTPDAHHADRRRRLNVAASHLLAAGNPNRARRILSDLVETAPPGPVRADSLWRLADSTDDLEHAIELCHQALAEAGDEVGLQAEIHLQLSTFTWLLGRLPESAEHTRTVARLAEASGDTRMVAIALGETAHVDTLLGRGVDRDALIRAIELERSVESFPPFMRPSFQMGVLLTYTDELDEARPLLRAELDRTIRGGDESGRAGVLFRMVELELRAGNWDLAREHAEEALRLSMQSSIEQEQRTILSAVVQVAAHQGREDDAREAAERGFALTRPAGDRAVEMRIRGGLGLLELSLDRPDAAIEITEPAVEATAALGIREFSIAGAVHVHMEALVAAGRPGDAEPLVDLLRRAARPTRRSWSLAMAARGRALVHGAAGELDAALGAVAAGLKEHDRLPQPFERARTILVRGTLLRRALHRREAREAIEEAAGEFERLGALLWARTARAELGRIGGRSPSALELTPTERRVAELVAQGRTNREVANALFVAPRTVEGHVSRIFGKLGVRSRAELAHRMRLGDD